MYKESVNTEDIRSLANSFLLGGNLGYYHILKASDEEEVWKTVVDGLLDEMQAREGAKHASLNRQNPYPEVLKAEGKQERLLSYIQKNPRLIRSSQDVLLSTYKGEVFALYGAIIKKDGEAASTRNEYKALASWLKALVAIGGKAVAKECVLALAPRYMKRPAMKDEIKKVGLL